MRAHYGYEDGSGRYYITIDTDRCNGCAECVRLCPAAVLEMVEDDPLEPAAVAAVTAAQRNRLREACAPCKASGQGALPCVAACAPDAITHSF